MRMQINQFVVLAGLTALETIRQPVCLILLLSCLGFTTLLPAMLTHTFGEEIKIIRDSASPCTWCRAWSLALTPPAVPLRTKSAGVPLPRYSVSR